MKSFWKDWRFWVCAAVVVALVIAGVVCHLVQPQVTYAWLEMVATGTFLLGCVCGALVALRLSDKK